MFRAVIAVLTLASVVSAHFQLLFPPARGPFVAPEELNFCGGYTEATNNRTLFPLSNGFVSLHNSHPHWTAAILISIDRNPNSFSAFNTSENGTQLPFAVPFFNANGAGDSCIRVDIQSLNIPGVGNGSNITLQTMLTGGDGNLFQCSDVTLSDNVEIPSNFNCTNVATESSSSGDHDDDHDDGDKNSAMGLQWSTGAAMAGFVVAALTGFA